MVLSHIMKIENNSEARLVFNLRLYNNAEQIVPNGRMQINPKFKIFKCAFFDIVAHDFLLNL